MNRTPADVIDLVTTRDAATFVDAINSILNRKAAESISGIRQEVAQNIINPADPHDDNNQEEIEDTADENI